jgi:hypothetical protein
MNHRNHLTITEQSMEYITKKKVEFSLRDDRRWIAADVIVEMIKELKAKGGLQWN